MKKLIIGIIFLIICIGLAIFNEIKINNDYKVNIHDITNSGSKTQDVRVYLNATYIAGTIKDNYYVMFGDGVQYIVYMDSKLANKINKYLLDNPDSYYQIKGITKTIPEEFEEKGIKKKKKWLDLSHDHSEDDHSHQITKDDFYHYFGHVYLDSTLSNNIIKIIIYITGTIGILLIFCFIIKKYKLL